MRRTLVFVSLAGAVAVAACQLVAGIERVEKVTTPPDVVEEAPPPPPDPCLHVTPASIPDHDDALDVDIGTLYLPLRRLNLVAPPGAPPVGLDLDGVCTCDTRTPTAYDGGSSCTPAPGSSAPCDPDGGIDNAFSALVQGLVPLYDIDQKANINSRIDEGQQDAVIVITRYNGRANDKEVGVGLFLSEGILEGPNCPDSGALGAFFTPGWCGQDKWSVSTDSVNASGAEFAPKASGLGWVNDYQLVVSFNGTAAVPFGGYRLAFGSPRTVGKLVGLDANGAPIDPKSGQTPALWSIDGVLTGRVAAGDLLSAAGSLAVPGADAGTHGCSSPLFGIFKGAVCDKLDISHSVSLDFDPHAACDAISAAVAFHAEQAKIGAMVATPDSGSNECLPDGDGGAIGNAGVSYRCP